MGRYFLHMRRADGTLDVDQVGAEFEDDHAAADEAAKQAKDLKLRGWSRLKLEVHDQADTHVATFQIDDFAPKTLSLTIGSDPHADRR